MLVLRRRSQEVIVFDGGLTLTVAELVDHHAWLSFEGPDLEGAVTIAPMAVTGASATIGIRSPERVTFDGTNATIERSAILAPTDDRATLVLTTPVGGTIDFGGLSIELTSVANNRAALGIDVPCLPSRVTVAVHTVSGVEVRIGIDAPPEVRVTRKELWLELLAANQAASEFSPTTLDALRRPADFSEPASDAGADESTAPSTS